MSATASERERASTRLAMLDAGIVVHQAAGRALLQRTLSSHAVASEANVHRQTFYRYWDTVGDYIDDLVDRTMTSESVLGPARASFALEGTLPLSEALRQMLQDAIDRLLHEPSHRLRLTMWSVRQSDAGISEKLHGMVDEVEEHVTGVVELICRSWNREPLPPLDAQQIGVVVWSLALGMALRADALDRPEETALFPDAVLGILPGLTRRIGDDRDLTEVAAVLDQAAVPPPAGARRIAAVGDAPRQVVLEAARLAIEEQGTSGATPVAVAARSGLTVDQVRSAVGGSHEMVRDLLEDLLLPLSDAAAVDEVESTDAAGMLRRQVHHLALVCARHRSLFAAATCLRLDRGPADPDSPLEHVVARTLLPLVEAGQRAGDVRRSFASEPAAELLADLLVMRIVGSPAEQPAHAASAVLDLWHRGTQTGEAGSSPQ